MTNYEGYYFLKTHEWVKIVDEHTALCGISDFAQKELGDIVYISLPEVEDTIKANESYCDVESVKAVSDVFSPISGEIIEVNEDLEDAPELLNEKPYETWIIKVKGSFDVSELMTYDAYHEWLKQEE